MSFIDYFADGINLKPAVLQRFSGSSSHYLPPACVGDQNLNLPAELTGEDDSFQRGCHSEKVSRELGDDQRRNRKKNKGAYNLGPKKMQITVLVKREISEDSQTCFAEWLHRAPASPF